ncbi:MAG: hypothetical protein A2Y10_02410 [Planctomycetes bacterium GWF2_41_51]|nr:MAG: hypothetical protein A2Y10_02410 [Planctomycetes bacterium GWF2_41_51]HBG27278.1 hypothetical protein [Phycisphaerales bacterium]
MANVQVNTRSKLALLGGGKSVESNPKDVFSWPIITREHEEAVLEVLRARSMSGLDVTKKFEMAYAKKLGMEYGLGCNNGTAALHCAYFGLGIGYGDEVIGPSMTYWATLLPVYSLGATVVFADVDPNTLCINPNDIEHRITKRTKAIVVVHWGGMPADMDNILSIAQKHNLKVIEDFSHAHGALYKGKEVGTFGDVSVASLMSAKSFAVGEAGIMFTNVQYVYERALLFGHYERHNDIQSEELKKFQGLPCGGYKYRMHQLSSAFGLVTLKLYDKQMSDIDNAMNYFCDLIEEIPGITPVRPPKGSNTTKGGWFAWNALYDSEKFEGLTLQKFAEAVEAEGSICWAGGSSPLHLHPVFQTMDIYNHGRPTRIANSDNNSDYLKQGDGSLPVTESLKNIVLRGPWFRRYYPEIIKEHAKAYEKVASNYKDLLPYDDVVTFSGGYSSSFRKQSK